MTEIQQLKAKYEKTANKLNDQISLQRRFKSLRAGYIAAPEKGFFGKLTRRGQSTTNGPISKTLGAWINDKEISIDKLRSRLTALKILIKSTKE